MSYEVEGPELVKNWSLATHEELRRGYEAMAADEEREKEAFVWIESRVGECL